MSTSRIGRYEIVRPIGRGAMGVVYLARDPSIERDVALKTVRFDGPAGSFNLEESKARFLKEAKISGRLHHPNIVTIFDVGEDGGVLYLAMEYVSGGSLSQKLAKPESLSINDRIRVVGEVAAALAHAHEKGVIHRDIKPANILLTEALMAKVTDFGIGKLLVGDTDLTSTGQMVGSPSYMSPEQIRGEKLDVRSDIFSLGVVLYQTLTERKPFPADTLTTLVYQILHEQPPEPALIKSNLPPEIAGIVKRCLAKSREERYANAGELAEDLAAVLGISGGTDVSGTLSESITRRRARPSGLHPAATGATAGAPAADAGEDVDETVSTDAQAVPAPPTTTSGSRPGVSASSSGQAGVPAQPAAPAPAATKSRAPLYGIAAVVLIALAAFGVRAMRKPVPDATPSPTPVLVAAAPTAVSTPVEVPTVEPTQVEATLPTVVAPLTGSPVTQAKAKPTAKSGPAPTATAVPATPTPPAVFTYATRRFVKLAINPASARVFLDGKYVGIADDWDDSGGGALLTFFKEGKYRLRIAAPGRADLNVDVTCSPTAQSDKVEVRNDLATGEPTGWPGPQGDFKRPDYRTVGPVRFNVEPADAVVEVNGKYFGPASQWASQDLDFKEMAVYEVKISAPNYETKVVRLLAAPSAGEAKAVIKERLKKAK